MAIKTILISTTGYSSWTVPADWSSNNTIRVIGGGGGGGRPGSGAFSGSGGGGGGMSISTNISLTPGTVLTTFVGTGGANGAANSAGSAGGNTWINFAGANAIPTSNTNGLLALGGGGGSGNATVTIGVGGNTTASIGVTRYAGGNGGLGATTTRGGAGGGGSAASDLGNGGVGGTGTNIASAGGGGGGGVRGPGAAGSLNTGGIGGNTYLNALGGVGGNTTASAAAGTNGGGGGGSGLSGSGGTGTGGPGTEYTITAGGTAGAGGGGGGGRGNNGGSASAGSNGGLYGGGGGGGAAGTSVGSQAGAGAQGAIIITYAQPVNRYWVGGSGTWNNTSTTNWSYTSGGAAGADPPTSAENAIFDANSASGPFTVTIGASAACANFDASAITQAMTISGTAAMTVGGSLTWPSTNFTNSYTGAITFSATSSVTITTGGKVITSDITFNGVGGTWSLQDALTIGDGVTSRAVGLTNGTLQFNTYTMTVNGTFNSNNSNTRGINFGTGKLVYFPCALGGESSTTPGFDIRTTTGWTTSGTAVLEVTGAIVNSNKYINIGTLAEASLFSLRITSTSGQFINLSATWKDVYLAGTGTTTTNAIGNANPFTIYGNFTYVSGAIGTGGNITFAGTTGTQNIISGGITFDCSITFSGTGTYSLQDAMTVGTSTSRTVTLTTGTLELNSYTMTVFGPFAVSGTGIRKIQMSGTGGKIVLSLNTSTTVWSNATVTNMTTDGNVVVQLTGGGATTKTIAAGALSEANAISFQLSTTAGTVTFTANDTIENLTIDNNAFTLANIAITIYGNLLISGTSPTISSGINVWTFAATSGTKTITTNGKSLGFPITFNGLGGTWALQDALSGVGAVILTAGTIELNSYTFTMSGFSSSNTNTRRIQMSGTGGKIVVNTSGTFWNTATTTGLTTDGNVLVQHLVTSASTSTVAAGMLSEANAISFQITKTSGSITFTSLDTVKNLTYDGACSITNVAITIYGNFSIGTSMTQGGGSALTTFAATSGVKTITMNGVTLLNPVLFDGLGGTWQLQDNMTVGTGQTQYVTLNAGTINLNGKTLTTGSFSATGTGAKVLAHGTDGSLVIVAISGTVFNATGSNLTSTGTGTINLTGATSVTFAGGGNSYNTLNRGAAAAVTITGSNTFKDITNTAQPLTVNFTAGTTTTFTSGFSLDGTPGNLVTIKSATNALHTLTKTFAGNVTAQYCSISYSMVDATGWYADSTSIDAGNNYQWIFSYANGAMIMMFQ